MLGCLGLMSHVMHMLTASRAKQQTPIPRFQGWQLGISLEKEKGQEAQFQPNTLKETLPRLPMDATPMAGYHSIVPR